MTILKNLNWILILVINWLALITAGCFVNSNITNLATEPKTNPSEATPTLPPRSSSKTDNEFISGATIKSVSNTYGYKKYSTIESPSAHIYKVSNSKGYKLYMTVQGQIISKGSNQ